MGSFTYLMTGTLWFLLKFICTGAIAFAGVMAGAKYRKNKDLKAKKAEV
ncbi:MAG: hypothetical protein IKL07_07755 [Clostridium sp.]|nr:hypothetical protein [Clostridium sp.]